MNEKPEKPRPATLLEIVRAAYRMAQADQARQPREKLAWVVTKLRICEQTLVELEPPHLDLPVDEKAANSTEPHR